MLCGYCDLILASPTIMSLTKKRSFLRTLVLIQETLGMSWAVKAGRKTQFKASLQNLLNTRIGDFRYPLHTRGWVKIRTWHCFIIVQLSKQRERGRATAPPPCVVLQPGNPQQVNIIDRVLDQLWLSKSNTAMVNPLEKQPGPILTIPSEINWWKIQFVAQFLLRLNTMRDRNLHLVFQMYFSFWFIGFIV